ncbi:MAG: EAL domain-containing protein [Lachnospiraceae bacterium]|nr:EAL domain-containing protein [Lachnospiraceae bacterium]
MEKVVRSTKDVKRNVLVVDDEFVNRQLLGFILSQDYEVLYAEDGKEALEKIREMKDTISLVFLDLLMPEIDGFEVLKTVSNDNELRHIPVIVLTSEKSAEVESLQLGAVDFITKPYDMPEIILARARRNIELAEDKRLIEVVERDELTGLYLTSFFYQYARQMEKYYPDKSMDAFVIDVDHFHLVNEIYGKEFGDSILKKIADIIKDFLDNVGGLGCRRESDTFFVYCTHQEDYVAVANKFKRGLAELLQQRRARLRFGVFPAADKTIDVEQRFDGAKLSCNSLRDNYTKSIAYYDAKMHDEALFEERLINDMDRAIAEKQFVVYYQPKYAIQGEKPRLYSAEALIRWKHPELGMISPGKFIPLFENNGLIQMLDHFVWREVGAQIRKWKDEFGVLLPVSVNVSRIDIYDPNLEKKLFDILNENGLDSEGYMLEVTESAYADDSKQLIDVVQGLRDKGFHIEMDDFGAGYSSLNMLAMMPIDALKLDMMFIRNAHKDKKSFRLIELVLDIAKYLEVPVIAEGVEEEEQYQLLKKAGCDIIQGYYFSKPVPAEEFSQFFKDI